MHHCHPERNDSVVEGSLSAVKPVNLLNTFIIGYLLKGIPPLEDSVGMT